MKKLTEATMVLAALAVGGCTGQGPSAGPEAAHAPQTEPVTVYFQFSDGNPKNDFVAGLSDPAQIQHAREAIAGTAGDNIPMGQIAKGTEPYNPGWHFNFIPASVRLVARAPESCNVMTSVFDAWITAGTPLPMGNVWCPYGERPVRELPGSPFSCDFIKSGTTQSSCSLNAINTNPCKQTFSPSIYGQCQGRNPGGVNQLACFFANPLATINTNKSGLIDQPGVYAVGIEWINWTVATPAPVAPIVIDYKEGQEAYSIACTPVK